MILRFNFIKEYGRLIKSNDEWINTYANHLIVIFAFSIPILVSVRRVSISLIILLFLIRGQIWGHVRTVMKDPLLVSFIIYFVIHLLWLVGSDDSTSAMKSVHDAAFLLFAPLFATFIDRRFVNRIAGAFVLGMVISSFTSYGIFFGFVAPMLHDGTQGGVGDPTPIYHHTHYGYMLAITSSILLYKVMSRLEFDVRQLINIAIFFLISVNMLIIEGRSGFIIFSVLVFSLMILHYKKKSAVPVFITIVSLIVLSVFSYKYIDVFKDRVDLTIKSSQSVLIDKNYNTSIGGRVGMAVYSLDVISKSWVIGNGTGDHVSVVRKLLENVDPRLLRLVRSMPHVHNEYLSSLMQFGLLGLLAFLNIPFQMMRYSANGVVLKILGISVLLYTLIDVFIMGLGMMLTVGIISSVFLNKYYITNTRYRSLNISQLMNYTLAALLFYLIKLVFP